MHKANKSSLRFDINTNECDEKHPRPAWGKMHNRKSLSHTIWGPLGFGPYCVAVRLAHWTRKQFKFEFSESLKYIKIKKKVKIRERKKRLMIQTWMDSLAPHSFIFDFEWLINSVF